MKCERCGRWHEVLLTPSFTPSWPPSPYEGKRICKNCHDVDAKERMARRKEKDNQSK